MEKITSLKNEKIKTYSKLLQKKYRDQNNMFIVEGYHLVNEAKKTNLIIEILTSDKNIKGTQVTPEIIKKISEAKTPQPVIAICKKPKLKKVGQRVLVLNKVQDPGNVGTLIRSAKAFGWDTVLVQGADIYSPKVIRSSQGAIFHINTIQIQDCEKMILGKNTVGAVLDPDAKSYKDYDGPKNNLWLILGNEGKGIESKIIKKLKHKIYIPISFESLNVASAGAILLNEYK